jgi:6-phosphogluconolactonase (cycloisomerase 2 family)
VQRGGCSGAALGSQGAVVVSDDGRRLVAVNAGDNTVSLFDIQPDGLELVATAPSGARTRSPRRCTAAGIAVR